MANPISQAAARHSSRAFAYRELERKLRTTRDELQYIGVVYGDARAFELAGTLQRASVAAAAKRRRIMKGPPDVR